MGNSGYPVRLFQIWDAHQDGRRGRSLGRQKGEFTALLATLTAHTKLSAKPLNTLLIACTMRLRFGIPQPFPVTKLYAGKTLALDDENEQSRIIPVIIIIIREFPTRIRCYWQFVNEIQREKWEKVEPSHFLNIVCALIKRTNNKHSNVCGEERLKHFTVDKKRKEYNEDILKYLEYEYLVICFLTKPIRENNS